MKLKLSLGKDYTLDFAGSSEEFVKTIPFILTGTNQLDDTKSVENDNPTVSYVQECQERGLDLPAEEYVNKCTKILHVCSKGHTYKQTPNNHLNGQSCPICSESQGSTYIKNYLDKNNIKYEIQRAFMKDLDSHELLVYDFYLPDCNILIDYQGKQHYEKSNYFGRGCTIKQQQLHDKMKREYAKENGYKLLEIKYTLNTQELVDTYLKKEITKKQNNN